ncbi:hypothetical protein CEE37_05720 [candidate division LCP-89 bacterium B3_LCP]|uniref:Secretion system C-terminal sorting domain-containing protein n=1 Tax=candidate division LCP-89 bacterium B3_LCP TaxID=2012998 RepID=A0A532V1S0_UNCL8|nr:MAG: hypothetical protein CEE37_05720 [candidate division LCP-89 bacterium B3_LCP]
MKYLTFSLLFPLILAAQESEFQQEYDSIPVEIDGWIPFQPWMGGFSNANPDLEDLDDDGKIDILIGSTHFFYLFWNEGNQQLANFSFAPDVVGGLETDGWSAPVLCDIDNDDDLDLFATSDERVWYFENIGTPQYPQFEFVTDSLEQIIWWGVNLDLIDIDADGDYDLFTGSGIGTIRFYENNGTPFIFYFNPTNNMFENIDVGDYSDPCYADIDYDDDYDLFIGDEDGRIWYYRNDGDSVNYNFTYVTDYYEGIDVGDYSSPEFADIDGDGDYDLFVGREPIWSADNPGDVFFYENIGSAQQADFQLVTANYLSIDEGHLAKMDWIDIDADGDEDMFTACGTELQFYRNVGTNETPSLIRETSSYQNIEVDGISPFFCDIDADGDYDLFSGEGVLGGPSPGLYLFINRGTPEEADFILYSDNLVPGTYHVIIYPTLADIDADEDFDLFLCDQGGSYFHFENTGTIYNPNFVWRSDNWQGIDPVQIQRWSRFWDIDDDGDLDLFFNGDENVAFYRNTGTPDSAVMILETPYGITGLDYSVTTGVWGFDILDIDADGDGDFFGGNTNGGTLFFRNVTGQNEVGPKRPDTPFPQLDLSIGPNPANPITWISFTLPSPQEATLAVYNILGAKVTTLTSGIQPPGTHTHIWNAADYSSGVYIIQLETPQQTSSERITVLK